MGRGTSLGLRALLALVLFVLFVALALAIMVGLLWVGFWLLTHVRPLSLSGWGFWMLAMAGCVSTAGLIAWSLIPGERRSVSPGPELDRAGAPALFAWIDGLAARAGVRVPTSVHLADDARVSGFVQGGLFGLGGARGLVIGLPVAQTATAGELAALVTRELVQLDGGELLLGGWIHATRATLQRTIERLDRASEVHVRRLGALTLAAGFAQQPLRLFGALYLRMTRVHDRAQLRGADLRSAGLVGASTLIAALERQASTAALHERYRRHEVTPLVDAGHLPPLADGFALFLSSPRVAAAPAGPVAPVEDALPLADRLAALRALPAGGTDADPDAGGPALALLPPLATIDRRVTEAVARRDQLRPTTWAESGPLLAPTWRPRARRASRVLAGYTPGTLPTDLETVRRLAGEDMDDRIGAVPAGVLKDWAAGFYGAALVAMLVAEGFAVHNLPGQPLRLVRGELTVEPYDIAGAYLAGELDLAGWARTWTEAGISERRIETALRQVA